jgi:hypothetical protein
MFRILGHTSNALRYIGLALLAFTVGCADAAVFEVPDAPAQRGRIQVQNDEEVLRQRVQVRSELLPVVPVGQFAAALESPGDASFALVLVGEVEPPALDGTQLQASHSVIHGSKAYVAYNVQGPVRKGGVDVFDMSQPDEPALISQALITDTDVSALHLQGSTELYLATATDDMIFESPAVLEVVDMQGGKLTAETHRVDLPSYAGTGVHLAGGMLYVTSGTGGEPVGGLSIFDPATLALMRFDPFDDARAVDVKGGVVVAMRGTPGGLRFYDAGDGAFLRSFEPGGANVPESKATVFLSRGCAFYAAGDEGLRVVNVETGVTVATLSVPDIDGVAIEHEVTNGASHSGNLVFIANGGAGLFVAQATHDLDAESTEGCNSPDFGLTLLGQVQFPGGPSANYVDSKGNLLFVANGLGGLSIVRIDR